MKYWTLTCSNWLRDRFHARDAHLVLSRGARQPIPCRVLLDGEPPGPSHGVDVSEDGNGVLLDCRQYQLVREHDAVRQRTLEITFVLIEAWARNVGVEIVNLGTSAEPRSLPADRELVIALGGDGTILRALQLAMTNHAAVLGINFGIVGFLADSASGDLAAALGRIARGEAQIQERIALAAMVQAEPPRRMTAFNDVVVARVPGFGTARLRVDIDGQAMLALAGDGVVIASPTGSTAYTLGAGGPAVAPTLDGISQGSPLRSLVVDGTDTVRVIREPSSAPLSIEVDGRKTVELPASASLEVHAAPRKARLVRTRSRTFYADLVERL